MALLKEGARGSRQFPGPVQRVKGNSPLWSWYSVVTWLVAEGRLSPDSPLIANARTLDCLNLALQLRATVAKEIVLNYLQQIEQAGQTAPSQ